MAPGSVFSGILQTITSIKLEELSKQHSIFQEQHANLLSAAKEERDPLKRLIKIVDDTKTCLGSKLASANADDGRPGRVISGGTRNNRLETDLINVDRFLDQAQFDPSVSPEVLKGWEEKMIRHVSIQATKFQYASLYGKLVTEWLFSEQNAVAAGSLETCDSFEELPGAKKLEARREWEKSVFEPAPVELPALKAYLEHTFDTNSKKVVSALGDLRRKVRDFESSLTSSSQFDKYTLQWVVKSLQTSDLVSNEKREVLGDFLSNEIILAEIADVLNIRMEALDRWTWGDHVSVEQRRQINGQYQIHMDEDILQAIFLHYIGVKWSVFFKSAFLCLRDSAETWRSNRSEVVKSDKLRRRYFLGSQDQKFRGSLDHKRSKIQRRRYFTNQLLDHEEQQIKHDEGEEEADYTGFVRKGPQGRSKQAGKTLAAVQTSRGNLFRSAPPPPAGRPFGSSALFAQSTSAPMMMASRSADVEKECEDDDIGFGLFDVAESEDDHYQSGDEEEQTKNPMAAKQSLLHILATEIILNTRLHGEMTCFRTMFKSWDQLLPHDTALNVLEFFGVSNKWKKFFRTYLEAPLKFVDDSESTQPRVRRRGAPGSHTLSNVLGEVVLFCLDFSVNQETDGALLHRSYDDVWFWNRDYETCATAWASLQKFARVTGTQIDIVKSGSVRVGRQGALDIDGRLPQGDIRWGFLYLNPTNGRFDIDRKMVEAHAKELRQQLQGRSKSVIDWIQAWNSYATTFFSANFGTAANCFGREHIDTMLATHRQIQESVFDGGNVVQHLKQMMRERFDISDLPDGFLYFPVELGGLELKSPFIDLLQIRDSVKAAPHDLLHEFEEVEKDDYADAKRRFDKSDLDHTREHVDFRPDDADVFFDMAEFTKHREAFASTGKANLCDVYTKLLERPHEQHVDPSMQVIQALQDLQQTNLRGILAEWYEMDAYWKWVAQMYGPAMIARFGGFNVVDPGWLPIGMVSQFRQRRTKWQG